MSDLSHSRKREHAVYVEGDNTSSLSNEALNEKSLSQYL